MRGDAILDPKRHRQPACHIALGALFLAGRVGLCGWVSDYDSDSNAAAYVPLDEGQGAAVRGAGPNQVACKVEGNVVWARGRFRTGLQFDGTSAALDLVPVGMGSQGGTVQLWVNVAAFGRDRCLWDCAGKAGGLRLDCTKAKRLSATWQESGAEPVSVSSDVTDWRTDQWHQVALLWELHSESRLLLQLYVDGRRVGLKWAKFGLPIAPEKVRFGATLDGENRFAGVLDELLVLNVSRKPMPWAEIGGPLIKTDRPPRVVETQIARQLRNAGEQVRLQRMANQIVFHNNRVAIAFLDEEQGLGLANVYHLAKGVGFGAKTKTGYRGLVWRLALRTDRGRGNRLPLTNRSASTRKVSVEQRKDGAVLRLRWEGLDLHDEKAALDVTVTVRLRHDSPRSEWRISVDNRSRVWSLWEVYFPELDLGQIGDGPEDDFLVFPRAEGRCHKNPIYGWGTGYMTGAAQPHGHDYPGGAHMQFAAYYEKDGGDLYSAPRRAGLYLATEDGQLNVKKFLCTNLPQADMICYEVRHYPPDMVTAGSDYDMPFDFVAEAYDGDWYDAAMIYRRWALRQLWCRRGPFVSRDDIPQWFKEADFFFRADSRKGTTTYFRDMCRDALKTLHPPVCCHWYSWMSGAEHGNHSLLQYLPPKPGIADAWRGAREESIHIFPYINAQIWGTQTPSFEQARPYTIKDECGKVVNWSSPEYAQMCRTQKWWRDVLTGVCEQLVKDYEVGGLYLDQLGHAFNGLCLDPTHGHALGGGNHAVMGARAVFEEVRERVGAVVPVLSEASSEENIDVSAGKIIHYNVWPGFVPLFSAVYHDWWSFYGRNVGGYEGDALGFMNTGMIFIVGGQIGRIWPGRIPNALKGEGKPWVQEQAEFIRRTVRARRAGAKFLRYGRMLRPLQLVGSLPTVETRRYRGPKRIMSVPVVLPVVLSSVWRAPDGEVGIVLANISDEAVSFAGRFAIADYGLSNRLQLRPVVGKGGEITAEDGAATLRTQVAPHEVQIMGLK